MAINKSSAAVAEFSFPFEKVQVEDTTLVFSGVDSRYGARLFSRARTRMGARIIDMTFTTAEGRKA